MTKLMVSAPAKLMLAGEYAVLQGHKSLAVALSDRLTVAIEKNNHEYIELSSDLWPNSYQSDFSVYDPSFADDVLLDSVFHSLAELDYQDRSFSIKLSSEINLAAGFGSSSALRLALAGALILWQQGSDEFTKEELWQASNIAFHLQKQFQGHASGYDVITQALGGLVLSTPLLDIWPGKVSPISCAGGFLQYIEVFVSTGGLGTKDILSSTANTLVGDKAFCLNSDALVESFLDFSQQPKDQRVKKSLFALIRRHRLHMQELAHYPSEITEQLDKVAGLDRDWTYKTTGAGGRDAIVLISMSRAHCLAGKVLEDCGWNRQTICLDSQGLVVQ